MLDYERVPVGVVLDGSTLVIETPWDFPGDVTVFALTGVHDPFNPSGWRPLADAPSPWAYSGGEQVAPVIDLLAPSQEAQERALRTGVLPMPSVPARDAGTVWLVLMLIGVLVALTGLVLRRRVPRATGSQLRTGLPPEPVSQRTAGQRQVLVVAPAPAVDQSAEPVVRERVVPRVVPTEPGLASDVAAPDDATGRSDADGEREPAGRSEVGEPTDPAGPSTRAEPPLPVAAPEPEDTPASPEEAPALSGVSAFDSFVLLEATMEEQEDEGFGELTREKGSAN